MKITFISSSDTWEEDHDYRQFFKVNIDDLPVLDFCDGEPEDATLSRDFSDVFCIPAVIERVVATVKAGEEIVIENRQK